MTLTDTTTTPRCSRQDLQLIDAYRRAEDVS